MGIELFATACTIARTQRLIDERGAEACARELAMCDLFCVESGLRFRAARARIDAPEDEVRRDIAKAARAGGGYVVQDSILVE
jgi:acyl-CoA dehydrogenase family protein 9